MKKEKFYGAFGLFGDAVAIELKGYRFETFYLENYQHHLIPIPMFVHRNDCGYGKWTVTEGTTGMAVCFGDTRKAAMSRSYRLSEELLKKLDAYYFHGGRMVTELPKMSQEEYNKRKRI